VLEEELKEMRVLVGLELELMASEVVDKESAVEEETENKEDVEDEVDKLVDRLDELEVEVVEVCVLDRPWASLEVDTLEILLLVVKDEIIDEEEELCVVLLEVVELICSDDEIVLERIEESELDMLEESVLLLWLKNIPDDNGWDDVDIVELVTVELEIVGLKLEDEEDELVVIGMISLDEVVEETDVEVLVEVSLDELEEMVVVLESLIVEVIAAEVLKLIEEVKLLELVDDEGWIHRDKLGLAYIVDPKHTRK
jgi:hypothetical protein